MATKWHNTHIPTQWGVAILGFLVLSTALLIPYLSQYQNLKSDAMVVASKYGSCKTAKGAGTCQNYYAYKCSGAWVFENNCSGPKNIECCVPKPSVAVKK